MLPMATLAQASRSHSSDSSARLSAHINRMIGIGLEITWLTAVLLVPLIVLSEDRFTSFTSLPKVTLLRSLASLLVFLLSARVALFLFIENGYSSSGWSPRKVYRNPGTSLIAAVVVVLFVTSVSTVFSISPLASLWGKDPSGDGSGLYASAAFFSFFIVIALFVREKPQVERLWAVISITGLIGGLIGIAQHFGLSPLDISGTNGLRVTGTSGNPIFFGSLLVVTGPIGAAYLLHRLRSGADSRLVYALAATGGFTLALALLATLSRGPWLGAGVSLVVFLALGWKQLREPSDIRMAVSFAAGVVIAVVVFFAPLAGDSFPTIVDSSDEVSTVAPSSAAELASDRIFNSSTTSTRLSAWRTSLDLLAERPDVPGAPSVPGIFRHLLGYGPDTFRYAYALRADGFILQRRTNAAHNDIFNRFVEQGLFGAIAWIALWGVAAWAVFKLVFSRAFRSSRYRLLGIGIASALAGRFSEQLTGIPQSGDSIVFWVLLGLLAAVLLRRVEETEPSVQLDKRSDTGMSRLVRAPLFGVCVAVGLIAIFIAWDRNVDYARADIAAAKVANGHASGPSEAIELTAKAVALAPDVPEYRHIQSTVYQGQVAGSDDANRSVQLLQAAYEAELVALERYPFDREMYFRTAAVTWELGKLGVPGKAQETLRLYEELSLLVPNHELVAPRLEALRQQVEVQ